MTCGSILHLDKLLLWRLPRLARLAPEANNQPTPAQDGIERSKEVGSFEIRIARSESLDYCIVYGRTFGFDFHPQVRQSRVHIVPASSVVPGK